MLSTAIAKFLENVLKVHFHVSWRLEIAHHLLQVGKPLTLVRPWRLPLGEDSLPLLYETLRER
ncbi:hypothetical protein [aff. Roholtiella sp. LEGE 12411]|uniref:hypothetical protein n=1 Tax=aff. Roholtiella sp. LEGE 12411 TaxID=1828822 RepID=UPI0018815885|nr:hypothetical protein [aff. Roholtiella sp. LEGE 12411]MBE9036895.1 hypothetical protein [aff. Roholtiella sp. LEGE 12411]